jgi:hypothetical protein
MVKKLIEYISEVTRGFGITLQESDNYSIEPQRRVP